jgi:rhamnosyltransferase|tara:strand:+ start:3134 stop:4033 length:900 start_codon:yes stop_codon:yes gene_type:complete
MKLKNRNITLPNIAVLLTVYNGRAWMEDQIESILLQREVNIDLYISVDLSIDGSYERCLELSSKKSNIKILPYGDKYGGAALNFFRLIRDVDFTDYDFISLADHDDVWLSDKLNHAVKTINSKNVCALSSDVSAFFNDTNETIIKKSYPQKKFDYYFESAGPGCTYVIKTKPMLKFKKFMILNFRKIRDITFHDWLIYAYFRENSISWYIDSKSLIRYRNHEFNTIGANFGIKAYLKRYSMIKSGWYKEQVESILAIICPDKFSILKFNRLSLIKNFWHLRRRPRDAILFMLMLVTFIY